MQVIGRTNEREVLVASAVRRFRLNELLIVEDESQNNPVGEVVETGALNPLTPEVNENSPFFAGQEITGALAALGYNLENETVYVGKVRLLDELFYPIPAGCRVREPRFSEVKHLLIATEPANGVVWGVIRGTESLIEDLPPQYQDLSPVLADGQLKRQPGVPLVFDYRALQDYPHIGVFGGSGSGKSFGLRVLIEEFMEAGIPLLVIDPHYEMSFSEPFVSEWSENAAKKYSRRTSILVIGQDVGVSFAELTENDLTALLDAVSPLSEAMDAAVKTMFRPKESIESFQALLDLLVDYLETGESEFFTHFMERRDFPDAKKNEEFARIKKLAAQVGGVTTLKAIRWRLARLISEGVFLTDGDRKIIEGIKNGQTVVLRGSSYLIRVYSAFVLRRLYRLRRNYRDSLQRGDNPKDPFPPFIIVTDEAHIFAPRGENNIPSRREIREIAQEGRKYGVFLVLATQRPFSLDETVNAQLNTKLIFRTVRSTDLSSIREETDLSPEDIKRLPYLKSGNCFLSSPVFGRTLSLRIRAARTRSPHGENPFDELITMLNRNNEEILSVMAEIEPFRDTDFPRLLRRLEIRGLKMSLYEFERLVERWCEQGILILEEGLVNRYRINRG